MSEIDQNVTFTLHEKIYVHSGQEIAEMLHMSLEPNVIVRTYSTHLDIDGKIELQGEYVCEDSKEEKETKVENVHKQYVNQTERLEKNRIKFIHQFPISISTPKHRVKNTDDITVTVASFDYELPTNDCILLKADIHINGIQIEQTEKEAEKKAVENERKQEQVNHEPKTSQPQTTSEKVNEETMATPKKKEEAEIEQKQKNESDKKERVRSREQEQASEQIRLTQKQKSEEKQDNEEEKVKERAEEKTEVENKRQQEKDIAVKSEYDKDVDLEGESFTEEKEPKALETDKKDEGEIDIQLRESEESEEEKETESITFLTELFSDEVEKRERITIYIAQEDDTIESIAKQYDLSPLDLIKVNRLKDEPIEKGQLIYVPKKKSPSAP